MKTILVPVDFSPITAAVVTTAVALAQAAGGRAVLLHVVPPPPVAMDDYAGLINDLDALTANAEMAAEKSLTKIRRQQVVGLSGIETRVETGSPIPLILETARKLGADYIVIGSHGHAAFYDLLIGSTTRGVLRRANCPVVVVPAERAGKKKLRASSTAKKSHESRS